MFEVVAELAREEISELPDSALSEELVEIRQGIDRLEAEFARRLALFDRRQGFSRRPDLPANQCSGAESHADLPANQCS